MHKDLTEKFKDWEQHCIALHWLWWLSELRRYEEDCWKGTRIFDNCNNGQLLRWSKMFEKLKLKSPIKELLVKDVYYTFTRPNWSRDFALLGLSLLNNSVLCYSLFYFITFCCREIICRYFWSRRANCTS